MNPILESPVFSTLIELIHEKISLIEQQTGRLPKLWANLWYTSPKPLPEFSLLTFNEDRFLHENRYRIEFLHQFQEFLQYYYFYSRALLEEIFNHYFESSEFSQIFSSDTRFQVMIKAAFLSISSLSELISIDSIDIPVIYLIIGKFSYLLKIRPLSIFSLYQQLQELNVEIELEKFITLIQTLINMNYFHLDSPSHSPLTAESKIKVNDTFFSPSFPQHEFDLYLKSIFEWISGLWQSLYNFRRLNQTLSLNIPFQDELQKSLSWAATQGLTASLTLFAGIEAYFTKLESITE